MTRLEKIKNFDMWEMAKFLSNDGFTCDDCEEKFHEICDHSCVEHCLHWLKEQVTNDGK